MSQAIINAYAARINRVSDFHIRGVLSFDLDCANCHTCPVERRAALRRLVAGLRLVGV